MSAVAGDALREALALIDDQVSDESADNYIELTLEEGAELADVVRERDRLRGVLDTVLSELKQGNLHHRLTARRIEHLLSQGGEGTAVQCDSSCHDGALSDDSCPRCGSGLWEQMCDSCRSYAAEDGEPDATGTQS